jgi:hypothetical protein
MNVRNNWVTEDVEIYFPPTGDIGRHYCCSKYARIACLCLEAEGITFQHVP